MKCMISKRIGLRFDKGLYQCKPMIITSDYFWDGGICEDSTLKEKAAFYAIASRMSDIIKAIVLELDEDILIGAPFCEFGEIFAHWSNLKDYELFRTVSQKIVDKKCYKLQLPADNALIDLFVESNFRYFTYVSLYLPTSNVIIQPTCHTEVLVYAKANVKLRDILRKATDTHSDTEPVIRVTDE